MSNTTFTHVKQKIFKSHVENISCTFDQLYALTHTGKNASDRLKAIDMYLRYMLGTDKLIEHSEDHSQKDFVSRLELTQEEIKVLMGIEQRAKREISEFAGKNTPENDVEL